MPDQLQPLIERIQKEAVDDAEIQARKIVEQAQAKAEEVLKQAHQKAEQHLKQAERDAEAFAERSKSTLDQAARDLLLRIELGVDQILSKLVAEELDAVLDDDGLLTLLGSLVESYLAKEGTEARIDFLVSPKDHEQLVQHFRQKYGAALGTGVKVDIQAGISKGFMVTVDEGTVSHDFTREAMVESLTSHLRPILAESILRASKNGSSS